MARPIKSGLDYFPLDVDFFSDKKTRILKSRYGADGIAIFIYILCEIYRNGYWICADDDFIYLASDDLGMSVDKIRQVISFLAERLLFDNTLFRTDTVLTSAAIQRRYQTAVLGRAKKRQINVERYWLLEKEETDPSIKVHHFSSYSEKNQSYSEKNQSYSEKNPLNKSKEKESKVNDSRVRAHEDDEDLKKVCKAYEDSIGLMPRHVAAAAMSFIQAGIETDLVIRAIELAAENNARTWSYVSAVLRNCESKGINTLSAFEAESAAHKAQKEKPEQKSRWRELT